MTLHSNRSLAYSFLIVYISVDFCSAALQKIMKAEILKKLLKIPCSRINDTLDLLNNITDQERKDFKDLIEQSQMQMVKVIGSIIISLINKDPSKFKTFLQVLQKSEKVDEQNLAQELGK